MPGFFSEDFLEEVRSRNDIRDIVSRYVPLKVKGDRFWGLCPFHGEKTPSFSVHPDRGMYYCFGCHSGGNVIHFIMNIEKMNFPESVRFLAERAGLTLPDEPVNQPGRPTREFKDRLYEACTEAARFFHNRLQNPDAKWAADYLAKRGITEGMITKFGLGYAPPNGSELAEHLKAKGFSETEMDQAGLMLKREGRNIAAFRKRLIFPIIDTNGKVAGFGARSLDDSLPKYINTSDTPIFNKRKILYSLNNLKKGTRPASLIVVEGYMDAIALYQSGTKNAVASLGTALSVEQARLMRRYAPLVFIAYDGDAAGQNATLRGLDILSGEGLDVKVIPLPADMDPDDFVRTKGKDAFASAEKAALPLTEFKLKILETKHDLGNEDGRMKLAIEGLRLIAKTDNAVERDRYLRSLQKSTGYGYDVLREQLAQELKTGGTNTSEYIGGKYRNTKPLDKPELRGKTEKALLGAMSTGTKPCKTALQMVKPDELKLQEHRDLARIMQDLTERGVEVCPNNILALYTDDVEASRAAGILETETTAEEAEKVIHDCVNRLLLDKILDEIKRLQEAITGAPTRNEKEELTQKLQALTEEYTGMKKNAYAAKEGRR
jgi:DNA primase